MCYIGYRYTLKFTKPINVSGADFMASVSKIISYLLCTILILKAKQAGRIASTIQFIFWFLLAICQGFTFGSVVNHDLIGLTWTSAQKIIAVISWVLIVLNFIVYCFADKAPEYIDLKGNPKSYFYLPLYLLMFFTVDSNI